MPWRADGGVRFAGEEFDDPLLPAMAYLGLRCFVEDVFGVQSQRRIGDDVNVALVGDATSVADLAFQLVRAPEPFGLDEGHLTRVTLTRQS